MYPCLSSPLHPFPSSLLKIGLYRRYSDHLQAGMGQVGAFFDLQIVQGKGAGVLHRQGSLFSLRQSVYWSARQSYTRAPTHSDYQKLFFRMHILCVASECVLEHLRHSLSRIPRNSTHLAWSDERISSPNAPTLLQPSTTREYLPSTAISSR